MCQGWKQAKLCGKRAIQTIVSCKRERERRGAQNVKLVVRDGSGFDTTYIKLRT
jgi:hypothetical protein